MHREKISKRKQTKLPSEVTLRLVFGAIKIHVDKRVPNLIFRMTLDKRTKHIISFARQRLTKSDDIRRLKLDAMCFRYEFRLADLVM